MNLIYFHIRNFPPTFNYKLRCITALKSRSRVPPYFHPLNHSTSIERNHNNFQYMWSKNCGKVRKNSLPLLTYNISTICNHLLQFNASEKSKKRTSFLPYYKTKKILVRKKKEKEKMRKKWIKSELSNKRRFM